MIKQKSIVLACMLICMPADMYASRYSGFRERMAERAQARRHKAQELIAQKEKRQQAKVDHRQRKQQKQAEKKKVAQTSKKKNKTRQKRLAEHGQARGQKAQEPSAQKPLAKKKRAKQVKKLVKQVEIKAGDRRKKTKLVKEKPVALVKEKRRKQAKVGNRKIKQEEQEIKKRKSRQVKKVSTVKIERFENYKENSMFAWADDSQHWAVPVTLHGSFSDKSFNDEGNSCSLADLVFGQGITVQDILLISRLSREAKVSVAQSNFPGVFQRPANVPAVPPNIFGVYGSDQFLGLLAPMRIKIGAERRELGADISSMYKLWVGKSHRFTLTAGITLPLKSVTHITDISFLNAQLPIQPGGNIVTGATANISTNPIAQFFSCFGSLEDFVIRGIFEEIKGICFDERQHKVGAGDLNLFTFVDMAGYLNDALCTDRINSTQLGVAFILPTGNKDNGTRVWEPILGNGGAFQIDLFGQLMVRGAVKYVNPSLRVVGSFSVPYTNNHVRVPAVVTNNAITACTDIPGLRTFGCTMESSCFVQPFQEVDSTIPMFADNRVPARIHYGSQVIIGLGNSMYDLFNTGTRLELFYEFLAKQQDSVEVKCACQDGVVFDTCELTNRTQRRANTFSWNLTYEFPSGIELNIGSLNIFSGKNVPRYRDIFGGVAFVF